MPATLQIEDYKKREVVKLDYQGESVDLLTMMRDLVEVAMIGDRIELIFNYDTINAERCRNFLSIMQIYEYTRTNPKG